MIPLPGSNDSVEYVKGSNTEDYHQGVLQGHIRVEVRKSLPFINNDVVDNFDPFIIMNLFRDHNLLFFESLLQSIKNGGSEGSILITKQNGVTTLTLKGMGEASGVLNSFAFNEQYRGCLTQSESKRNDLTTSSVQSNYEEVNGIFVPKEVILNSNNYQLKINFEKNIVNQVLSDDVFSLKTLGAMQGDLITDMRTDLIYPLSVEQCPECPIFDITTIKPRASFVLLRYVFICAGIVLCAFAVRQKYFQWKMRQL